MPIYAAALSVMGVGCDCIGALGYPELQEKFRQLGNNITMTSVANAGRCTALEFDDGKVMLADNGGTNSIDFALLLKRVGEKRLMEWLENADAFALLNWSELPGMTSVWRGLLDVILPGTVFKQKKLMIIDISDCSRRSPDEIREMAAMVREFARYFKVVFSLNLNETLLICGAFNGGTGNAETAGRVVYDALGAQALIVHLRNGAYLHEESGVAFIPTSMVESPRISTGGGDNFNAGLTYALLMGIGYVESVAVANAASMFYIANGRSASHKELLTYMSDIGRIIL